MLNGPLRLASSDGYHVKDEEEDLVRVREIVRMLIANGATSNTTTIESAMSKACDPMVYELLEINMRGSKRERPIEDSDDKSYPQSAVPWNPNSRTFSVRQALYLKQWEEIMQIPERIAKSVPRKDTASTLVRKLQLHINIMRPRG